MKILVTGSTGFIGSRLVRELSKSGHELFLLVRSQSKPKAQQSFSDVPNLTFVEGDILETDVIANIYTASKLIDEMESVVHLAALYDLEASLTDTYLMNVVGTQNIINLLRKMKNLKSFHYFSTYAVNPATRGTIFEDTLTHDELKFPDDYTKTKNNAEHIVKNNKIPNVKTIIHRPGIIIGDSLDGKMDKVDGPYYFFDFIQKLKKIPILAQQLPTLPLPVLSNAVMPVLPVDTLVKWSTAIINRPPKEDYRCYHLVPKESILTREFLEYSMKLLGLPVSILPVKQTQLFRPLFPLLKLPQEIIFYMNQTTHFDRTNLEKDYPELDGPLFRDYLPKIIEGHVKARP